MKRAEELELAWAAGFFDGEGSVFMRRIKRHKGGTTGRDYSCTTVEMSIAQVQATALHRFVHAIGCGSVGGPYTAKTERSQPYYKWNISGRPCCHRVLVKLWPYMSEPKKAQARHAWTLLAEAKSKKSPPLPELPR